MFTGCHRCPCPRAEKHPRPSPAQKSLIQCFSRRTVAQSHVLLQAEELREFERGLAGPLQVVQGNPGPEPQHLCRQGALTALLYTFYTKPVYFKNPFLSYRRQTAGRTTSTSEALPRPFGSSLSGRLQRFPGKESTFPATGDFCTRAAGPHLGCGGYRSWRWSQGAAGKR